MGARVFISSGQDKQTELPIVRQIANHLEEKGFEPYIASIEQVNQDVNANLFEKIKRYEYFLIINFKRISIYTHQEFAIACLLKKPFMAFQEAGIPEDYRIDKKGVGFAIQVNPIEFSSYDDLYREFVKRLDYEESRGKWEKTHREEITIEPFSDEPKLEYYDGRKLYFFHLKIRNNSKFHASKCAVYLRSAIDQSTGIEATQFVQDLKWAGLSAPFAELYDATKTSGSVRDVAAVCAFDGEFHIGRAYQAVDNKEIPRPIITGPGKFLLTFHVLSDTLPEISRKALLTLGKNFTDFKFKLLD